MVRKTLIQNLKQMMIFADQLVKGYGAGVNESLFVRVFGRQFDSKAPGYDGWSQIQQAAVNYAEKNPRRLGVVTKPLPGFDWLDDYLNHDKAVIGFEKLLRDRLDQAISYHQGVTRNQSSLSQSGLWKKSDAYTSFQSMILPRLALYEGFLMTALWSGLTLPKRQGYGLSLLKGNRNTKHLVEDANRHIRDLVTTMHYVHTELVDQAILSMGLVQPLQSLKSLDLSDDKSMGGSLTSEVSDSSSEPHLLTEEEAATKIQSMVRGQAQRLMADVVVPSTQTQQPMVDPSISAEEALKLFLNEFEKVKGSGLLSECNQILTGLNAAVNGLTNIDLTTVNRFIEELNGCLKSVEDLDVADDNHNAQEVKQLFKKIVVSKLIELDSVVTSKLDGEQVQPSLSNNDPSPIQDSKTVARTQLREVAKFDSTKIGIIKLNSLLGDKLKQTISVAIQAMKMSIDSSRSGPGPK